MNEILVHALELHRTLLSGQTEIIVLLYRWTGGCFKCMSDNMSQEYDNSTTSVPIMMICPLLDSNYDNNNDKYLYSELQLNASLPYYHI